MISRQPSPNVPSELKSQFTKGSVVPLIGAGISKSLRLSGGQNPVPDKQELFQLLINSMESQSSNWNIDQLRVFEEIQSAGFKDEYFKIIEQDFLGDQAYRAVITKALLDNKDEIKRSMVQRLLRVLNFDFFLTTNYDRFLETFVAPSFKTITPFDIPDINRMRDSLNFSKSNILKIHGDILAPETITSDNYFSLLEESEIDTSAYQSLLEIIFKERSVLFLGYSFMSRDGFIDYLLSLDKANFNTHFALIPDENESDFEIERREEIFNALNIEALIYKPDQVHSQVWEFLAELSADKPSEELEYSWRKSYLPEDRISYLEKQLSLEKESISVRYFTPTLTNAISTIEFLENFNPKNSDVDSRVKSAMINRRNNLFKMIEKGEEVRILFLKTEFDKSLIDISSNLLDRYKLLLRTMKFPNLEVRLLPDWTAKDLEKEENSFALLFSPRNLDRDKQFSDVSMAFASQATVASFRLHFLERNTDFVFEKVLDFERFWSVGMTESETQAYIAWKIENLEE